MLNMENSHLKQKEIEFLENKLNDDRKRILQGFLEKKDEYRTPPKETKDEVDSANESILVSTSFRFTNRENFYVLLNGIHEIDQKIGYHFLYFLKAW